jgi:hypothetical protein
VSTDFAAVALRCAEHPGRPAHDRCPRCDRPRCEADAELFGERCCGACRDELNAPAPAGRLELLVRAGLASVPAVFIGAWIATEYVEDHLFSLIAPALIGLAASWAAGFAATRGGRPAPLSVVVGAVAAVLGTALGFHLVPGGWQSVLRPLNVVGAPYVCAVLGALAFPILFGAPKKRRAPKLH